MMRGIAALMPGSGGLIQPMFSDDEVERYARHLVLRELGGPGQQRLKQARVLVVGAGGLGAPAALYLAAAGVGTIGLVDDDAVALSNLQRQVLYATDDVGAPKAATAAAHLKRLNPLVEVRPHPVRLDAANAPALLEGYDLALDGVDNFETRFVVRAACLAAGTPHGSGGAAAAARPPRCRRAARPSSRAHWRS